MLRIIEAHWSTKKGDYHSKNDAEATYAVVDENKTMFELFTKRDEAEDF